MLYSSQWNCRIMEPFQIIRGDQAQIYVVPNCVEKNKLASLEATLVRNYDRPTQRLTGVKCRATSVAKNQTAEQIQITSSRALIVCGNRNRLTHEKAVEFLRGGATNI